MLLDLIESSKKTKTLLGFHYYGSEDGFFCGYVVDYTDEFVIIQHYSKFGTSDGIVVQQIADIQYVESENGYLKAMQLLIEGQDEMLRQRFPPKKSSAWMEGFASLFESMIGNKQQLLKFELTNEEIYFGFLEWFDGEHFSVISIDGDGSANGKSIFRVAELKTYWIDDLECRKRTLLHTRKSAAS